LIGVTISWGLLLAMRPVIADEPEASALTAEQVLERMAKAYANCKTYRDSGNVKTVFFSAGGKRTVNKPFETAFVRPNVFRFEYRDRRGDEENNRYLIWSDGKAIRSWWDVRPGIEKPESIGRALAAATGVSGGSARRVPSLLMRDDFPGAAAARVTDLKRIEDATQFNVDCFRVEGKYAGSIETLWLDKETFLLRRIDSPKESPTFRTEVTTTYDPVVDGEITDQMLIFDPPQ